MFTHRAVAVIKHDRPLSLKSATRELPQKVIAMLTRFESLIFTKHVSTHRSLHSSP